jgi:hypothetical protein
MVEIFVVERGKCAAVCVCVCVFGEQNKIKDEDEECVVVR